MGKDIAYFKVLSWHLPWETEENHEKLQLGQLESQPQDSNLAPPKYMSESWAKLLTVDLLFYLHIISTKLLNGFWIKFGINEHIKI
jgi:hypothetical protein